MSAKIAVVVAAMIAGLLLLTVVAAAAVETGVDLPFIGEEQNETDADPGPVIIIPPVEATDEVTDAVADDGDEDVFDAAGEELRDGPREACFPEGVERVPKGLRGINAALENDLLAGDMTLEEYVAWAQETTASNQAIWAEADKEAIRECVKDWLAENPDFELDHPEFDRPDRDVVDRDRPSRDRAAEGRHGGAFGGNMNGFHGQFGSPTINIEIFNEVYTDGTESVEDGDDR